MINVHKEISKGKNMTEECHKKKGKYEFSSTSACGSK